MDANNFHNLRADVLSQIFNFIILEDNNLSGFSKLLIVWSISQSRQRIKDVLERLNWDALYRFYNEPVEVSRDIFNGFITFAVRYDVEQAKFFNSTRNLFQRRDVQHHLSVLDDLSDMEMHDHLCTLNDTTFSWCLKVRVTRIWETFSNTGAIVSHNMLLLDCLNTHMHAMVDPAIWNNFHNPIVEGRLYLIINVRVHQAFGFYRPVSTDKCLTFVPSTIIDPYPHDDFVIPLHKFELKPLGDLYDIFCSYEPYTIPSYSTDVIGMLEDLEPLQTIHTHFSERQFVRFRITDGSVSICVSFWGPLNANTEPLYANNEMSPVIVILASIKAGGVHICSLPSSKIYINLPHEDVFMMRNRLIQQGIQP